MAVRVNGRADVNIAQQLNDEFADESFISMVDSTTKRLQFDLHLSFSNNVCIALETKFAGKG